MSTWRRKATALFPEVAPELGPSERTLFDFIVMLEHLAISAHATEDDPTLRRIHGFMEWCLHHPGELWNQAAIGFYETVLSRIPWDQVIPWLSPFVVGEIKKTWALGVNGERGREFEALVERRRNFPYRSHVFSTGEIDAL